MSDLKKTDLRHWKARLVQRKYNDLVDPTTAGHFSVRLEHDGTGAWFPLGSDEPNQAAAAAREIHRCVKAQGWNAACRRFVREFTLALFWEGNPLLCTYTTLLTLPAGKSVRVPADSATDRPPMRLVIVEADDEVRQGLVDWTALVPGCECVSALAAPAEARPLLSRQHTDLVLFNRSLPDLLPTGASGAPPASADAPAAFAFSIYEVSNDIFITHSGVSDGYFLRRNPPARMLDPAAGAWSDGRPGAGKILLHARKYFQNLVAQPPAAARVHEQGALTPREEEILLRLSKGYQDKQIAAALNISTWTVHNHIKNIFKKLGVHTRTQAVIKHLQK